MNLEVKSSLAETRASLCRRLLPIAGGISAVAIGFLAWALMNFGSRHDAWLYARGARVVIEPATFRTQSGKSGDTRKAVFVIRNLTSEPVRVLGVTTSCSCLSTDELPVTIGPRSSRPMRVSIKLGGDQPGPIQQVIAYHTDHPTASNLRGTILGIILASNGEIIQEGGQPASNEGKQ